MSAGGKGGVTVGVLGVAVAVGVWGDEGVAVGVGVWLVLGVSVGDGVAVLDGVSLVVGVAVGGIGSAQALPTKPDGHRAKRKKNNNSTADTRCLLRPVGENLLGSGEDLHRVEDQFLVLKVDDHQITEGELSLQDLLRERVLHQFLDGPAQRPRPVGRVIAALGQ